MNRTAFLFVFALALATFCIVASGSPCLGGCGATERRMLVHHLTQCELIAWKPNSMWVVLPSVESVRRTAEETPCTRCQGRPLPNEPATPVWELSWRPSVAVIANPSCIAREGEHAQPLMGAESFALHHTLEGILRPPIAVL